MLPPKIPSGSGRSPAPLPSSPTAIHAHRHRRESLRHSHFPRNHPAFENLVFHYCYHGTVDESFARLENGVVGPRRGNIGRPSIPPKPLESSNSTTSTHSESVKHHDVACISRARHDQRRIILPDDGY